MNYGALSVGNVLFLLDFLEYWKELMVFISILRRFRDLGEENHSNSFLLLQLGYETDKGCYIQIHFIGFGRQIFIYFSQ